MKNLRLILLGITFGFGALFSSCEKEEPLETVEQETKPIVTDTTNNNDNTQSGNATAEWRDIYICYNYVNGTNHDATAYIGVSEVTVYKANSCPNTVTNKTFSHNFGNSNSYEFTVDIYSSHYEIKLEFDNGEYTFTSLGNNADAIELCTDFDINDINEPIVIFITYE